MKIQGEKIGKLFELIARVHETDCLGCDACNELMDQLAQSDLEGRELCETLQTVRLHIENCKCCQDEYDALLAALTAIRDDC